jgi:hypothetical protein
MNGFREWFEQELRESPVTLSADGRRRRHELAGLAVGALRSRVRRRRAVRAAALVLAGACLFFAWPARQGSSPAPGDPEVPAPLRTELVATAPGVVDRLAALPDGTVRVERMDDAELLALLASAQRPTGLIRTPLGVTLTASVTDSLGDG